MAQEHTSKGPGARRELSPRARRYRRITFWSLVAILGASMALPLAAHFSGVLQSAEAQAVTDSNPRANYWRAVRDGEGGYSAVQGNETNVLINNGGQNYRQIRNGIITTYGAWLLLASVVLAALFFAIRGRIKVEGGMSGVKVKRWNAFERFVHWFVGLCFVLLAITGLSLLFGRVVLIPVMGGAAFAAFADIGMTVHNYVGPAFGVGVVLMILMWLPNNIPNKSDLDWFKKGGGLLGKAHPSAGRMNGGEKVWFWFIALVGGAVILTGVILDFPNYEIVANTRENAQLSKLIHAGGALVWIALWFGHAYIGTLGTEGALDGMKTGYVDANWAKQHHDEWFEKVKDKPGYLVGASELAAMSGAAAAGGLAMAASAGGGGGAQAPEDSVLRRHWESAQRKG